MFIDFLILHGDFNEDGVVGTYDLEELSEVWLSEGQVGDYDGDISGPNGLPDGNVDFYDYSKFSGDYGKSLE